MRRAGGWIAALVLGAALVAGLIAVLQSRDESAVDPPAAQAAPGERAEPPGGLAEVLERGNVLVQYTGAAPTGLGDDTPELREAGQAVIADPTDALPARYVAYSATHRLAADRPEELREFVDYWLGGR